MESDLPPQEKSPERSVPDPEPQAVPPRIPASASMGPPRSVRAPHFAQPSPGGGGGLWKGAAFLGFLLLGVSLLAHVASWFHLPGPHLGAGSVSKHEALEEVVIKEGAGSHKIAVLEISGVISSDPLNRRGHPLAEAIEEQLDRCAEESSVRAVVLRIDSPGGEVLASDDISRLLTKFQKEHGKPVVVTMAGVAASGGYYVAVPCQWIVANELTITGSIGVIMHGYNYRGLMDKVGVRPEVYKSGKFKDMMSGDKLEHEITVEEKGMVQGMINETFSRFKGVIEEGRNNASLKNKGKGRVLTPEWRSLADGRIFTGKQAFENGFVDELGNFDTAVARAKEIVGIEDATLVSFQEVYSISSLFRLFGQSESRASVKIDLGLDVPKVKAGRPYFLWLP